MEGKEFMRYFDAFAGAGGFSIGVHRAMPDAECVGSSEIDRHASAVLKYRFPHVQNYGDISKIRWDRVPDFDTLCGGSPCQSFSIAGKRAGFAGASGLFMEYLRCLQEKKPEHFIFENVKGLFSSNRGFDLGFILSSFSEAGYSLSWEVLNAKDFGVPQNRQRVFVVGHLGDGGGREVFSLAGNDRQAIDQLAKSGSKQGDRLNGTGGISPTVPTAGGGRHIPLIPFGSSQDQKLNPLDGVSQTLSAGHYNQPKIAVKEATKQGYAEATVGDSINLTAPESTTRRGRVGKGIANTLDTGMQQHTLSPDARIRRLTPIECERLMSWPDDWTRYGDYGDGPKEISDTQRYKMCGNGVVSNVVAEIIKAHIL